jgi:acetyl esterase/lipase
MTSKSDLKHIEALIKDVVAFGPVDSVERYRQMLPALLEDRKNRAPLPEIGAYHPKVHINENFTAAIAVPKIGSKPYPVVLNCHGHGAVTGSAHSYRRHSHDFAAAGYLTVTPDYRKAPENKHPKGLEDLVAAALWIKSNAANYGGEGSSIVIVGDSVGAQLAAATLLRVLGMPDAPRVAAFVGMEGFYARGAEEPAPFLLDAYMPEGYTAADLADPSVSPMNGFKVGVSYPPILLITGSSDFALPPTLQFALSLFAKQIQFQLHVIEGMPHDFMKWIDLDGYREGHKLMMDWLAAHR